MVSKALRATVRRLSFGNLTLRLFTLFIAYLLRKFRVIPNEAQTVVDKSVSVACHADPALTQDHPCPGSAVDQCVRKYLESNIRRLI